MKMTTTETEKNITVWRLWFLFVILTCVNFCYQLFQVFAAPESKLCELLAIYKKQQSEKRTPELLEEKFVTTNIVAKFVKLVVQVKRSSSFFVHNKMIQTNALGSKTSQIR
jgi:hypothetical protein